MLVINESHAQTCRTIASLGDRVIVQNVGKRGGPGAGRHVREEPNTKNDNNIIDIVYDGYQGVVTPDKNGNSVEKDAIKKYIWYHIEWDHSGKTG